MREVFGEILKKNSLIAFFDILDIVNAISQKVLVLESRNIYKLIEYNK